MAGSTQNAAPREGVVERLVPGGAGLVRDDDGVVFVDDVVPGERIRYAVSGRRGGARQARLLAVLQPSSSRVVPSCAHAGRCGGCDWLHLDRAAQTRGKEQIVDDALARIGRFAPGDIAAVRAPLVVAGNDDEGRRGAARRRARLAVDDDGRAGFFARGSHDVVVVDVCPALDPRLQATLEKLPPLAPRSTLRLAVDDAGHVVAAVEDARDAHALVQRGLVTGAVVGGDGAAHDDVVGDPLVRGEVTAGLFPATSDAACFTQATRFGGRAIVDAVVDAVEAVVALANDRRGLAVLELFAGSGHLTLPLAARGAVIDAVEGDPRGVRFLQQNAAALAPPGAVVVRRAFIDGSLTLGAGATAPKVVVADPPRTGIPDAARLLRRLHDADVDAVVMVSCDPATGARDLRAAVDAGFVLRRVVPIDAFPGTHHVEWVASLQRGGRSDGRRPT